MALRPALSNHFTIVTILEIRSVERGICSVAESIMTDDSAINKGYIRPTHFSMRMHETALFLLPVCNMTSLSCSSIPLSYMT